VRAALGAATTACPPFESSSSALDEEHATAKRETNATEQAMGKRDMAIHQQHRYRVAAPRFRPQTAPWRLRIAQIEIPNRVDARRSRGARLVECITSRRAGDDAFRQ